jgi:glycine/sarcosine N-methyltransferase
MEKAFFDNISSFYDDMIGFDAALEQRTAALKNFIVDKMEYAADIGCGTGLDSISLFKSGLKVRAFDVSAGMIEKAEQNAEKHGAKIKFYNSDFEGIPEIFNSSFDLVVSLGNTIANVTSDNIEKAAARIYDILKPGGRVVIQILNYERIKKNNERIVNITKNDTSTFVRFYDFPDKNINFNILRFTTDNPKERNMDTITLYPYSEGELRTYLEKNKFRDIEVYGSLSQKEYISGESSDLVVSAYK